MAQINGATGVLWVVDEASLNHEMDSDDLGRAVHISSDRSYLNQGEAVALEGNTSTGRATVRGAMVGDARMVARVTGATTVQNVNLRRNRGLTATVRGTSSATGTQVNDTPTNAAVTGTSSVSGATLHLAKRMSATVRGHSTVGAGGQPGINYGLLAISRGRTTPIFRLALDLRATSAGVAITRGRVNLNSPLGPPPGGNPEDPASYLISRGRGRVTADLKYEGASNLDKVTVFSTSRVRGDLKITLAPLVVDTMRGRATVVAPMDLKEGIHLGSTVRGTSRATSSLRGDWQMAGVSRGRTTPRTMLYRFFPIEATARGVGWARLVHSYNFLERYEGNWTKVPALGTWFDVEGNLRIRYEGMDAGNLLVHYMDPLPRDLVGQMWPRRISLPAAV